MKKGCCLVLALILCIGASTAHAQKLQVRTGEHDNYSRIVFDWDQAFSYKLQENDGNLRVSFNREATDYSFKGIDAAKSNLLSVTKLQDSPIIISLAINKGATYRDLKAGTKLILDVYTPQGGKSKPEQTQVIADPKKTAKPKHEEAHTEKVDATPPSQELLHSDTAHKTEEKPQEVAKAIHEVKPQERTEEPKEQAEHLTPLQKAIPILDTNMITVSATRSLAMAIFEEAGTLWMITDQKDLFVRPQAAGSKQDELRKFKKIRIDKGQGFTVKLPGLAKITASGSGLLWRIKLSHPDKPVSEERDPAILERVEIHDEHGARQVLQWDLPGVKEILDVPDPLTGGMLKVVTVEDARVFAGPARSFVEFDVLESQAGLALRPKVDNLLVEKSEGGIMISTPQGLSVTSNEIIASVIPYGDDLKETVLPEEEELMVNDHIYNFGQWKRDGISSLEKNRSAILSHIPNMEEGQQIEKIIALGKMHLANGYASESLGFFYMAGNMLPELYQNPQFVAMIGAARAMAWKSEEAFNALMIPSLDFYSDAHYWRAYVLADLGDWSQAAKQLPDDIQPIFEYPPEIRNKLGLGVAEVFLRDGNIKKADALLDLISSSHDQLLPSQESALQYLRGESARQKGNIKETAELWKELINGDDDLYRAKAGLAYTRLQIDEKKLDPEAAVDTLERLRYAWRGDELETQINYWLGRTYFEGDNFLKGLLIMRESAAMAPTPEYSREILDEMEQVFTNFYLGDKLQNVSALDAITLYEQFAEILPNGERGTQVIDKLARYLSDNNMYSRAADLFNYMILHRLDDPGRVRTGLDLAALYMLDDQPKKVLKALDQVEELLPKLPADFPKEQAALKLMKLRIKALSDIDDPDQALALIKELDRTPDINQLRADVAWNAEYWAEAADALNDVILDQQITMTRPLTDEQTRLILNRAIALNLDNDRIAIANMREKYSVMMDQTDKARIFEVLTRPRQNVRLADRDTLLANMSEVDLFQDFIESYREDLVKGNGEDGTTQ